MTPRLLILAVAVLALATSGAARGSKHVQLWSLYLKVSSTESNVALSPVGELVDSSCPDSVCRFRYPAGTNVTLSVVTAPGGTFVGWQTLYTTIGPRCSGRSNLCTIVMDGTKAERAVFSPLQVWRSSNPGGHVDISGGGYCGKGCTSYQYGSRIEVDAVADGGSHFDRWTSTRCGSIRSDGCIFTVTDNTYITAFFVGNDGTAKIAQPVTIYVPFRLSVFGGGRVTGPGGLNCPGRCNIDYERGRQIALTVTGAGSVTWGGACANVRGPTCVFRSISNSAGGSRSAVVSFSR